MNSTSASNRSMAKHFRKVGEQHLVDIDNALPSEESIVHIYYPASPRGHSKGYLLVTPKRLLYWDWDGGTINLPMSQILGSTWSNQGPDPMNLKLFPKDSWPHVRASGSEHSFLFFGDKHAAQGFTQALTRANMNLS
jgi:hypothetical protein